jgi:hypothetical protein
VLVRGFGVNEAASLVRNVELHFAKHGEWAVSCVSMLGVDAAQIVAQSPQIKQRRYRWGTVGNAWALGLLPVEDRPPHSLIQLPRKPDDGTWEAIAALLNVEEGNPHFEERRGR